MYTFSKAVSRPGRIGEWNTMEITLDGLRTVVHINDALVADYNEGDPVPPKKNTWDPERGPRPESGY
ncbi:family 16 glycoside hydrolase, partial [Microbulbifer okhotskensis]|uniref:family 16 glycoside hydrolase n=1 Tax=Microbulbifer okhotskensis TaxID=2926617 RepID=UPI00359CA37F